MANKRKILEDNCEEELEKKKEELEKYVEDHVNKIMPLVFLDVENGGEFKKPSTWTLVKRIL